MPGQSTKYSSPQILGHTNSAFSVGIFLRRISETFSENIGSDCIDPHPSIVTLHVLLGITGNVCKAGQFLTKNSSRELVSGESSVSAGAFLIQIPLIFSGQEAIFIKFWQLSIYKVFNF